MKTSIITTLITCMLLAFTGNAIAKDEVVATVNGKKITKKEFQEYGLYRQRSSQQKIEINEGLLHEMINRELLYAEAKKKKVDKDKEVKYVLEQQKRDLYIKALIGKSDVAKPIKDEELKKLYDENIKTQKVKEYNVRHVLLKTEAEAKTVIAELDGGAVFEDIAKNKSTGPSAKEGGSIGWVNSAQLKQMPAFAQAVSEMQKGSYSKNPVHTNYGWHVIKLEDSRKMDPPPFEKIKPQIAGALRQQRLKAYVDNIRKNAKIDIKLK